jgi:predicted transposase/invertase (TIGR01784 family)
MTDIGQPPIVKATVLNPFNIQEFADDKQIRLDIHVEDELGVVYNVEVQMESHPGFFDRMLYYWAEIYGKQIQRGEEYNQLCPVRSIIITEFPVFPELKQLHTVFEIRARENPAMLLSDHFQMHILRLGDLLKNNLSGMEQFGVTLQRWMQFWVYGSKLEEDKMSTMLQDVPEVQAAYDEYKRFTSDPVMQEKVRARERFLTDQYLNRADALAEGRMEGRIATARNLKRLGVPLSTITEATELPLSEIDQLD